MKLSEQLKQDHECGDFGNAIEGYAERAEALEDKIYDMKLLIIDLQSALKTCARSSNSMLEKCAIERKRLDV